MKTIVPGIFLLLLVSASRAQNTDLPAPVSNLQTLPSGSYVVAMDNTNQMNNSSVFNLKAYGLVVHLLNNSVKVRWVIRAGKAKDSTDFSVNATRFKPTLGTAGTFNFKAGPFVIFSTDTSGVAALIDGFNASITNVNDKIKVYQTNAAVTVDIRYDMTGFVPKAAILNDGGNQGIHTDFMVACNIPTGNYAVTNGTDLLTKCYTFASEPHNSKSGQTVNDCISAVKRFTQYGGNFLAECAAIETFENSSLGRFQTTTGLTVINNGAGTAINYPNPDLSYTQYDGNFSISITGSVRNWRINASGTNNHHPHARANSDNTIIGSSVSKMTSGAGGLVFYLGNHDFSSVTTLTHINGIRQYMNVFLTPAGIGNNCSIGSNYLFPLTVKLISFNGILQNGKVNLDWEVAYNESMNRFELEKSYDGISFATVGSFPASYKSAKEDYHTLDVMMSDRSYYRLKVIEKNQSVSYSNILVFQSSSNCQDKIKIMNNPVYNDRLNFEFMSDQNQDVEIKVSDLSGRIVYKQTQMSRKGTNSTGILLPAVLQPGIYILDLGTGSGHKTAKFIRQ